MNNNLGALVGLYYSTLVLINAFFRNFTQSNWYIEKKTKIYIFFCNPLHIQAVFFASFFMFTNSFHGTFNDSGEILDTVAFKHNDVTQISVPKGPMLTAMEQTNIVSMDHVNLTNKNLSNSALYDGYINRIIGNLDLQYKNVKTTELRIKIFFFLTFEDYLYKPRNVNDPMEAFKQSKLRILNSHPCFDFNNIQTISKEVINCYKPLLTDFEIQQYWTRAKVTGLFPAMSEIAELYKNNWQKQLDFSVLRKNLDLLVAERNNFNKEQDIEQVSYTYFQAQNYYNVIQYNPFKTKNTSAMDLVNGTYNEYNVKNVKRILGLVNCANRKVTPEEIENFRNYERPKSK